MFWNMLRIGITAGILLISSYTDLTRRKVYNKVTYPAIIAGLILCSVTSIRHLPERMLSLAVWFFMGALHLMGMGDLKLLMAVCAIWGFRTSLYSLLSGCLLLAAYSTVMDPKEMKEAVINVGNFLFYHTPVPTKDRKAYPFAVFLSAGTTAVLFWEVMA